MRAAFQSFVLSIAILSALSAAPASAGWVYRGNDTGGIIPWSVDNELAARATADAHCASYGKYARITSVVPSYGNYIGFNCLWRPGIARYAIPAVPVATACIVVRKRVRGHVELVNACHRRLTVSAINRLPR